MRPANISSTSQPKRPALAASTCAGELLLAAHISACRWCAAGFRHLVSCHPAAQPNSSWQISRCHPSFTNLSVIKGCTVVRLSNSFANSSPTLGRHPKAGKDRHSEVQLQLMTEDRTAAGDLATSIQRRLEHDILVRLSSSRIMAQYVQESPKNRKSILLGSRSWAPGSRQGGTNHLKNICANVSRCLCLLGSYHQLPCNSVPFRRPRVNSSGSLSPRRVVSRRGKRGRHPKEGTGQTRRNPAEAIWGRRDILFSGSTQELNAWDGECASPQPH